MNLNIVTIVLLLGAYFIGTRYPQLARMVGL